MRSSGSFLRVSVVVNTYNHERFVAQALRSVMCQNLPPAAMEIIVVDDGSTDSTQQAVSEFLPFIRYIRQRNGGQVSAFMTGIANARGEILAFLDGDDWWEKDKLSSVIAAFDADPSIAAVGHGYSEVNENGVTTANLTTGTSRKLSLESPAKARQSAPFRIFLGTSRLAIRKSVLQRTLPVPPDLPFFDNFIFSQAIAISGAQILPASLCNYRIHSGSLYAVASSSSSRLRTRYRLLSGLLLHLPDRLASLGVSRASVAAFLELDVIDRDRLKLTLDGGSPWETFCVERTAFRISYRNPSFGYTCFKGLVLFLSLLVPPKVFYRIHGWYGKHNLKRIRQWFGGGSLKVPQVARDGEVPDCKSLKT